MPKIKCTCGAPSCAEWHGMAEDCPSIHNPRVLRALLRAGLIQPDTDIFEAFCVWGRVINDAEVWRWQVAGLPADSVEVSGALRVLEAMSKTDLAALRQRIL